MLQLWELSLHLKRKEKKKGKVVYLLPFSSPYLSNNLSLRTHLLCSLIFYSNIFNPYLTIKFIIWQTQLTWNKLLPKRDFNYRLNSLITLVLVVTFLKVMLKILF